MTQRASVRLARLLGAIVVTELTVAAVLAAQRWQLIRSSRPLGAQVFLLAVAYSAMGVLLASRRPGNPIGWLFLLIGVSTAASALATALSTDTSLTLPGTPVGADIGAWLNQWVWAPGWISVPTFVLLLFPDGRLPSRRFRFFASTAGVALALNVIGGILSPDNSSIHGFRNPVVVLPKSVDLVSLIGVLATAVAAIGSLVGLVYRFRRSRADEREQLKWFVFAAIATVALYVGLSGGVSGPTRALGFIAIPLLPAATAIAILRYRLYDIDRIISRTVTYALVSAVVAGVYVLVVLVPTTLLGHGHTPTWLIAAGTIAAAAVFRPVRRRMQGAIDRRFNRSRYDAAWAIDAFATRLRNDVDIDELTNDLQTLVHQTMEPAHVSVWLKEPTT